MGRSPHEQDYKRGSREVPGLSPLVRDSETGAGGEPGGEP